MPAIRHASKRKAPPAGFSDIEDSLLVFANKMKDAENAPTTAAPKHQALWPIFQVSHQRSRYVWELYKQEKISKQLYEWLCKNGYADAMLIAKWKKDSYAKARASTLSRNELALAASHYGSRIPPRFSSTSPTSPTPFRQQHRVPLTLTFQRRTIDLSVEVVIDEITDPSEVNKHVLRAVIQTREEQALRIDAVAPAMS
ncbi:hypothetical protein V501_09018 [Pseudogymnoascus sp. VKM F-4519 (FW-2642)]|nr:hypothetical protein V501_09018 [Pseudogymnoascus sp. VKM F-4519 (FW-2642)]